jgi:hypothetical protein
MSEEFAAVTALRAFIADPDIIDRLRTDVVSLISLRLWGHIEPSVLIGASSAVGGFKPPVAYTQFYPAADDPLTLRAHIDCCLTLGWLREACLLFELSERSLSEETSHALNVRILTCRGEWDQALELWRAGGRAHPQLVLELLHRAARLGQADFSWQHRDELRCVSGVSVVAHGLRCRLAFRRGRLAQAVLSFVLMCYWGVQLCRASEVLLTDLERLIQAASPAATGA